MTSIDGETTLEEDITQHADAQTTLSGSLLGAVVRAVARIWLTGLILMATAFAGIAIFALVQTHAELHELRKSPGPDAYAVVAYRRELERQLLALDDGWGDEVVPRPPARPRLLEEIDLARPPPEQERVSVSRELAPISAPQ